MPYQYDPNLDPNEQQNAQQGQGQTQLAGGGQIVGGGSATVAGGGAPGGSGGGPKPTQPTGFVNLNDYLKANEGNGFGGQFSQKLNDETSGAQQAQKDALSNFTNLSNQSAVQGNSDLVNRAVTDPTGFVSNKDDVAAFQKQRDAQYQGPYAFADDQADYQKAYGATQKAKDTGQAAQTEGGRFSLLNNYFGTPNYSQGQQAMDNLLLQGDQTAQQGIQQAAQNANQAMQTFQTTADQAGKLGAQNAGNTAAARAGARGALGIDDAGNIAQTGAIPTFKSQQQQALTSAQQGFDKQNSDVQNALRNRDLTGLTPQELQMLGLGGYNGATYGVDPTTYYYQGNRGSITPQTVASAGDYSKIQALDQLAGLTDQTYSDPSMAGKVDPAFRFDAGAFQQATQSGQAAYNDALNGTNVSYTNQMARNGSPAVNFQATLPAAISDLQSNIAGARAQLQRAQSPNAPHSSSEWTPDMLNQYINQMTQQLNTLNDQKGQLDTQYGANQFFKR